MALTKKKGPVTTPKLPNIEALKKVNNNNAGAFYNDLLNAKHKIEYESRDISLFNIRTNPDNEIFREILRESRQFDARELLVLASLDVTDLLLDEESDSLAELQEFIGVPIRFQVESLYTQEQFDVVLL